MLLHSLDIAPARISRKPITMKCFRTRYPGAYGAILGVALAGMLVGCGTSTTDYQEFSTQEAESPADAEVADSPNEDPTNSAPADSATADLVESPTDGNVAHASEADSSDGAVVAIDEPADPVVASNDAARETQTTASEAPRDRTPDEASAVASDVKGESSEAEGAATTESQTVEPDENPMTPSATKGKPRKVEVLVKEREFRKEGPEGALRISYDDFDLLKVLNMDPVTPDAPQLMPDWLKHLDGKRVRVRGFMYPPFQETGIRAFVLARDNQICCFGRNPKIYDLVEVRLRDGVTTDYIQNRPFDVVGIFRIDATAEDGELYELYKLDDAIVIDN